MGALLETLATLRFFGEDLDPDEVTSKLGCQPSQARRKGGVWSVRADGTEAIARQGCWLLRAGKREPGDLDAQIGELFAQLTSELHVWRELSSRYQADIVCGLFMGRSNEGEELRPETLAAIGARGLALGLDIYGPVQDRDVPEPRRAAGD